MRELVLDSKRLADIVLARSFLLHLRTGRSGAEGGCTIKQLQRAESVN